jgi:hypothetical protein
LMLVKRSGSTGLSHPSIQRLIESMTTVQSMI